MFKIVLVACAIAFLPSSYANASQLLYSSTPAKGFIGNSIVSSNNAYVAYTFNTYKPSSTTLRLVNLSTKQEISFPIETGRPQVKFTPDSKWLVYLAEDGLRFVSTQNMAFDHVAAFDMDPDVWLVDQFLDFSKDSTRMAVSNKKAVLVFDVATGRQVFDSGTQNFYPAVKFFNKSNNISVFNMKTSEMGRSHHYIVDLAKNRMFNTCPNDNCFTEFTDISNQYSISADDKYIIFNTTMGCIRVCESKLQSYNIAQAKISTIYDFVYANVGGAYGDLSFDYDVKTNKLGFWIRTVGERGGGISFFSQASPNLEQEFKTVLSSAQLSRMDSAFYFPQLNQFALKMGNVVKMCGSGGCNDKVVVGPLIRDSAMAKQRGLIAIGRDNWGTEKSQVINLATGNVLFETQEPTTQDKPSFSEDERLLVLSSFTSGKDEGYIRVIAL